jgi:hypothetical protein
VKLSNEEIIRIMQGVIDNFLKPKFISLGMNATGSWLESLEARANEGNGEIWGNDYTFYLVNGRKPGKAPPVSALVPWVQAKLGIGGKQGVGIAFAISKKIAKEGTSYYPNGTDLLEVLESKEVIEYIYQEIGVSFNIQIEKQLKRIINDNLT